MGHGDTMLSLNDSMILVSGAFDLFPDAVLVVDSAGTIRNTNKQVNMVFGYTGNDLIGKSLAILLPERFRGNHGHHISSFMQTTSIRKMGTGLPLMGLHKSGKEINIDIALSAINVGESRYVLAVVRDITDTINIITRLGQTEKIKEELEKFAYVLTHDLKAPLARIKSISQLIHLELSEKDSDETQSMIAHLLQSVDGMEALIYGILDYYRAKLSRDEAICTRVDLNEILQQSLASVNIPATFKVAVPKRLPVMMGDKTVMLQVFNNLIDNAVHYNDKEAGLLQIDYKESEGRIILSFSDNGVRIPDEKKASIFELAVQLQKTRYGNHGLGLSIIQQLIEVAGGRIWCEDSMQGGTCFWVDLPNDAM